MSSRTYRIQEVSRLTGLSVRALHHYDEIGLVVPARSPAGYRLYRDAELFRLQQIWIGRELGLPLEQIRLSLDDPSCDLPALLRQQRAALAARAADLQRMLAAVDAALAALDPHRKENPMEGKALDLSPLFDGFDPAAHEAEASSRWGRDPRFAEAQRRTRAYGEEDWRRMRDEQAAIYRDIAAEVARGTAPEGPAGEALAERHRASMDRWFYPCDAAFHLRLADLYEADARFSANMDRYGEGVTAWLVAAVRARRPGPQTEPAETA